VHLTFILELTHCHHVLLVSHGISSNLIRVHLLDECLIFC
jgi:hypothetical protein